MNGGRSSVLIICATALLITILGGIYALAWHGTFTGAEVFGLITAIIGIAGGAFAVHSGVNAGAQAANTIPFSAQEPPKAS